MKTFLMFHDRDFDLQQELPLNSEMILQDLELNTLFNAMAMGDAFLCDVAKKAVLTGIKNDLNTIRYRQDVLKDCLKNPSIIRAMYDVTLEAIASEKKVYFGFYVSKYPSTILSRSIEVLQMLVGTLKKLRKIANEYIGTFESDGFTAFFTMLKKELDDDYLASVQSHLKELKFGSGALISAELGEGNKGVNYRLRKPQDKQQSLMEQLLAKKPPSYTFYIADRDESGARALSELKDQGINLVANALAQSTDHILSFFTMLRTELAFYIGCLNLHGQLAQIGEPVCFPVPADGSERRHTFQGLYDVCLALTMNQKIVGNDVHADEKDLVIITGANQGGKSTFLRSIGLAQLMMQCGMFAPAASFCATICDGLFTHYKREEDTTMNSGKLDEELSRMNDIVDMLTSHSMVLFNESFAATNEREGSEIARQIVGALVEQRIKVFFVTHLYAFAHGLYDSAMPNALFLRAQRQADGSRTFQLLEGEPLQTSYGEDLYDTIFGKDELQPILAEENV